MNWYTATLEVKGVLKIPLVSDTLWGHIAWSIALSDGEEALQKFIESYEESPPFLCSHAFPEGYLPKPILRGVMPEVEAGLIKKLQKVSYIPAAFLAKPYGWQLLIDAVKNNTFPSISVQPENRIRNSINRETSTVQNGLLWAERGYIWTQKESDAEVERSRISRFTVYCLSEWSGEEIQKILSAALVSGYGGKAGIGYGYVRVISVQPFTVLETGNRMMMLGSVAGKPSEIPGLLSSITVRRGKLGSLMAQEIKNPFKKPIVFFEAGSTCDMLKKDFAGTLIRNIHTDKRIVSMGLAPMMPFTEI